MTSSLILKLGTWMESKLFLFTRTNGGKFERNKRMTRPGDHKGKKGGENLDPQYVSKYFTKHS